MEDKILEGKVALVTGSGAGNGRGSALKLASMGAKIVVNDIRAERAEETAGLVRDMGVEALVTSGDATNPDDVARIVNEAEKAFGKVDILVNNVGFFGAVKFVEQTYEEWKKDLSINLDAMFLYSKAVLPGMVERKSGKIINISSDAGKTGYPELVSYSAGKHGVIGFTRALAAEVAKDGINVNAVCPGYIQTDMHQNFLEGWAKATGKTFDEIEVEALSSIPLGSFGKPEYVGNVVGFLASPYTDWMTGQALNISGGLETH
ncbi:MAG: SDR family NAD(P)-dependent oxidoreductase [Euryarchaeota archaeon]|nr:SDR family NAD(P)-dependent oxidoreductase [Euryarchaeota archaeon]